MSDIVERLRKWSIFGYGYEASCDMKEAATEIEHQRTVVANAAQALSEQTQILTALRAENERLREALREYECHCPTPVCEWFPCGKTARNALKEKQ